MTNPLQLLVDNWSDINRQFGELTNNEVLVGVPSDETDRQESGAMTNATLAYIHDNGSPAQNIPARPFMRPGIDNAKERLAKVFKRGAERILDGDQNAEMEALHAAGLIAQASIRAVINAGIAPPLADSTLRARMRKRRGRIGARLELESRAAGNPAGMANVKPLIDTGQLRNSINYVIRTRNND